MGSHHDNHTHEPKKVAFGTPLILGLVTLLAIVLLVSTCDKKHSHEETHGAKHEQVSAEHSTTTPEHGTTH